MRKTWVRRFKSLDKLESTSHIRGCASEIVKYTGMPFWKAMNIARWRAKHGASLRVAKVLEPDGRVTVVT